MTGNEERARSKVDPGRPPEGVADVLDHLYGPLPEEQDGWTPPPDEILVNSRSRPDEPPHAREVVQPVIPPADRRLLDRLHSAGSTLTIRVNGVELTLDVVDVSRTDLSICCLVKHNGLRCKIPRSEHVEVELEGQVYHTAFFGSWHTLDWLGLHIVVFPVLPPSE